MERYSLILVTDETAPIRRFDIEKRIARRALWCAAIAAGLLLVGMVDYVRVRIDQVELEGLRVETAEQRAKIESFDETLSDVQGKLDRLSEFERKVRIIANLPGSAAAGGEDVTAVGSSDGGDLEAAAQGADPITAPLDESDDSGVRRVAPKPQARAHPGASDTSPGARVSLLRQDAVRLGLIAHSRELSLAELVDQLESKRHRLASTPAIWPTKGWLTSRFGNRISPFTGGIQFHAGIDISGPRGTDIVAPARGRVVFVGKRGPLGQCVIVNHGFGVRTMYGHSDEILVKRGQEVERGTVIAKLGNSGRSTGPHLHYVVEVKGKAVNPLNYIFD